VCGLPAVQAVFRHKPGIVERLFFDAPTGRKLGDACRFLAQERKPYRQVEPSELEKIAGAKRHGGVVAVTRRRPLERATPKAAAFWAKEGMALVILDGVRQPRHLGALARTTAFFGARKFLLANAPGQALPSDAAYRSARGAMELLDTRLVDDVPDFLKALRASHFVIGCAPSGASLPPLRELRGEGDAGKPVALVFGGEEAGLSPAAARACQALAGPVGEGGIERLDLAAEAAVMLQKYVVEGQGGS